MRGLCRGCRWYHGGESDHCEAFPNLIPTPIWLGEFDHRFPWEGDGFWPDDRGIRFEPAAGPGGDAGGGGRDGPAAPVS